MNKLFTAHLPLVAKEHWKNGVQWRVWWWFTSLTVKNCLYGLPKYLFRDENLRNAWISKFALESHQLDLTSGQRVPITLTWKQFDDNRYLVMLYFLLLVDYFGIHRRSNTMSSVSWVPTEPSPVASWTRARIQCRCMPGNIVLWYSVYPVSTVFALPRGWPCHMGQIVTQCHGMT